MSQTIHMLRGIVTGDDSKFAGVMRRAAGATRQLQQAWSTAARDISTAATRVTAAVAGVGAIATKTFANFEQTMTRVGAVTRTLGTEDFVRLEEAARKAGRETRFTAQQSAEAMEKLGLAGFNVNEVIGALPGALQLASAAQIDIASAADIAAKTMRAFGFEASELGRINDTLVSAFTRSNQDIGQLAEALKQVGPVSKAAGLSLEDTVAIIAKMSDAGFQGSRAGTALRNALAELADPSKEAKKILDELGVEFEDTFLEKMRKIEAGIKNAATENERLRIGFQLFAKRGGPEALAVFEAGADAVKEFADGLREAGGIAQEIEQAQLNTLAGQFDILKSAIEDVFLTTGGQLNPTLRDLVARMQEFLAANRVDLVQGMSQALIGMANAGIRVVEFLRDAWPEIRQVATAMGSWVGWIVEYLANSPRLLAALIALKVTGFLGINQAIWSTLMLVGTFGKALLTLSAQALTANTSMATLGLTMKGFMSSPAGGLLAVAAATWALVAASDALAGATVDYNEAAQRTIAIHESQNRLLREQADARLKAAGDDPNLVADSVEAAKERRALAAQHFAQATQAQGDAINNETLAQRLGRMMPWSKVKSPEDAMQPEVDAAKRQLEVADEAVLRAEERLAELTKDDLNKPPAPASEVIVPAIERQLARAAAEGKLDGGVADEIAADMEQLKLVLSEVGDNMSQGRQGSLLASLHGLAMAAADGTKPIDEFRAKLDDVTNAISTAEAGAADEGAGGFVPVAPADVAADDGTVPGLAEEIDQQARDALVARYGGDEGLGRRLSDQGMQVGRFDDPFQERFSEAMSAMREGRMGEGEFTGTMGRLENTAGAFDRFQQMFQGIGDALPVAQIDGFRARVEALGQRFLDGNMSQWEYARSLDAVEKETMGAVEAQRAKELAEQREKLLKGDFSGLNFKQALEERIIQFRMQQFNASVEGAFTKMFGLQDATAGLQSRFNDLGSGVDKFGEQLGGAGSSLGAGGGGNAPAVDQAFGMLGNWLNSREGAIGSLQAQISLAQQRLNMMSDPGSGSFFSFGFGSMGYRDRRAAEVELQGLFRQLNSILFTPPPLFTQLMGDNVFNDPGLVSPRVNNVSLNLPNLNRLTNADARAAVDAIEQELARRGRRV